MAASKWRALIEQKASRGKLWAAFGLEQFCADCGNDALLEKACERSFLVDAENVRRLGTDGRWQHETPHKDELDIVRHSTDLRVEGVLMRQANNAEKSGDWGLFWKNSKEMASSACGQVRK